MRFFEMTSGAVLENLRTSEKGLTQEKARERLLKNGPNEIKEEKKKNVLEVFFSQFEDLLVIILLVCSAVSILTGNGRQRRCYSSCYSDEQYNRNSGAL